MEGSRRNRNVVPSRSSRNRNVVPVRGRIKRRIFACIFESLSSLPDPPFDSSFVTVETAYHDNYCICFLCFRLIFLLFFFPHLHYKIFWFLRSLLAAVFIKPPLNVCITVVPKNRCSNRHYIKY